VDGVLTDSAWQDAFKYDFGGGTSPVVVMRGIRGPNNNLFISIEANGLDILDTHTLVVLAFDPDGTRQHLQRIHIYPVNLGAVEGTNFPVNSFEYWGHGQNATTNAWNGPVAIDTASGLPSWLGPANVRVSYHTDATNGPWHWYLEMNIPTRSTPNPSAPPSVLDEVQVPTSGPFGLYVDVFRVKTISGGATLVPSYWPSNAPENGCGVGSCFPDSRTPDPSLWGTATLDPACGGASVTLAPPFFDNVFTNNSPNSKIALNAANSFSAYVQNTSIDASSGTAVGVPVQLTSTFTIANWGLPSSASWGLVPTTPPGPTVQTNPITSASIDANACTGPTNNNNPACLLKIGPWTLSTSEQATYASANMAHQCIRVLIAPAAGSNALILNSTVQRNMDFGNASKFERTAEVSAKGYPLPPHETEQLFDLHIITKKEVLTQAQIDAENANSTTQFQVGLQRDAHHVVSQLTWILEGCRRTGSYLTIKDQRMEICEGVGSFGYVIRHTGKTAVENWKMELTGPGLEKVPGRDDAYKLHVPPEGLATLTTRLEPKENKVPFSNRVAVFLDLGIGVPHGTFGSAFNTGFSLNAGLEYIATSRFSAEGVFGYHHFRPNAGSTLDLYQFSANGKFYLTSGGSLRPFVNGGVGGYKFSGNSTYFGGNFGAGVLREFGQHWGLQAAYNFHAINTPGETTKFSTVQGGLRFVF